ncbi:nitroreductase [Falsiroseomonas bella]|uniref:Nitroreductase n=1 Tax=Falsiroseomonas bella TaxID=2184016 RepID=A0A317FIP5_9PROT|nr:nitroreductase [Falsiroseomonas bella]PWS38880.1 nitroreductase [Falsiroseomonas bella]
MDVIEAMTGRRSIRGFLPDPVPRATVEAILAAASRAPSGSNIQPWHVRVTTGAEKARLSDALRAAHAAGEPAAREYHYYPRQWREPYLARRRATGWGLYGLLGIGRGDHAATKAQHARNYDFFGAPVGLFFSMDRDMELGSWLDCGMFIQNVMLAARGHGLETCAQAAFCDYHWIVRRELGLPEDRILVCGMSLGRPDPDEPANRLLTAREPLSAFVTFGPEA